MRRLHRLVLALPALLASLLTLSCFDAPIRRGLRLFFDADGSVEIHATTTIRREWSDTDQAAVRKRLGEARDAILHGEDFWSRTFRTLEPRRERVTYDYEKGLLTGAPGE